MASVNEVVNYLKSKYSVVSSDSDGLLKINFSYTDGRSQLVYVFVSDAVIIISSPVAKKDSVNLGRFIEAASSISPFGVREIGDFLAISTVALTETVDSIELDMPIVMIAEAADELEKAFVGKDFF